MIAVFKAQPTGDQTIHDLNLVATHEADARIVVSALLASLPGGTVDVRWPEVTDVH